MSTLNKTLIGLLGVQVVLAAALWLRPGEPGVAGLETFLSGFDAAGVEALTIFDAPEDGEPTAPAIELSRENGGWVLQSHYGYPADAGKVGDLLSSLAALRSRGPMASSPARHAQLLVAPEEYERRLDIVRDGRTETLYVGGPAGSRRVAARLDGSDDVHAVSGLSAAAIPAEPSGWIGSEMLTIPAGSVASLSVERGETEITLERCEETEGGWRIAAGGPPEAGPLDRGAVEALLGAATRIEAAAPADPEADFSSPLATVILRTRGEPVAEGLPVAAEEHEIHVSPGTEAHYRVRVGDDGRPAKVREWSLRRLVELDPEELLLDSGEG